MTQIREGDDKFYGAATAMFLLSAFALAFPFLSGDYTIPWDAKAHFQPQFAFLAHALHSGQSPFWTPNVFAGMPQIADPQSLIFSPFFLLAAWASPEPSFQLEDGVVFAMLATGGLALMLYFRDRGWHPAGALLAALAFAFGGSASWRIQHTGQVMSLAWLPVTLWLLARALDRRSMSYGAAAGAVAAFLVLGRDQVAFLSVLLLAAYALFRVATDKQDVLSAIKPLLAGALTGAAIIALPLAWTLDLAASSNRPMIDLDSAYIGSLPPASFLTLICANLFGTDGPLKDFWGPPSQVFGTDKIYLARNMTAIYMGALPILALLAAYEQTFLRGEGNPIFRRRRRAADDLRLGALHAGFRAAVSHSRRRSMAPAGGRDLPALRGAGDSWRLRPASIAERRGAAQFMGARRRGGGAAGALRRRRLRQGPADAGQRAAAHRRRLLGAGFRGGRLRAASCAKEFARGADVGRRGRDARSRHRQ